uniref:Uncharacterized protein n=1 Tax=Eutreptiella gymnastica TaxID=73025 RepID=A0A7S4FIE9_9EUGL
MEHCLNNRCKGGPTDTQGSEIPRQNTRLTIQWIVGLQLKCKIGAPVHIWCGRVASMQASFTLINLQLSQSCKCHLLSLILKTCWCGMMHVFRFMKNKSLS